MRRMKGASGVLGVACALLAACGGGGGGGSSGTGGSGGGNGGSMGTGGSVTSSSGGGAMSTSSSTSSSSSSTSGNPCTNQTDCSKCSNNDTCYQCCVSSNAQGYNIFYLSLGLGCGCTSFAPCKAECDGWCPDPTQSIPSSCLNCINSVTGDDPCIAETVDVCNDYPECDAFLGCYAKCPP